MLFSNGNGARYEAILSCWLTGMKQSAAGSAESEKRISAGTSMNTVHFFGFTGRFASVVRIVCEYAMSLDDRP